jgi:hypothetical protein
VSLLAQSAMHGATLADRAEGGRRRERPVSWAIIALGAVLVGVHLLTLHQGSAWASPLLLGDWLFTVAFAAAVLLYATALGRVVARPLLGPDQDWMEDLTALGLGLGMLFTGVLCLGFLRLYYGPVFLLLWLALTVILRRELGRLAAHLARAPVRWVRAGMPTAPSLWQRVVLLLVFVSLLHLPLRTMLPVSDWDAVAYHLTAPKLYLGLHRFVGLPELPLANAPSGLEMIYLLGLAAGTDGLGKVLMLSFTVMLSLVIYALARRLCHAGAGWIAALSLLGSLWLVAVMPLTLTDGAGAFLLALGVYEACRWAEEQAHRDGAAQRPWRLAAHDRRLARSALLVGLAVCCKLTNIPGIPALVAAVGLVGLAAPGATPLMRLILAARSTIIAGCLALAPLLPWLLKNLYFFGNPLYPSQVAVSNPSHGVEVASGPVSTSNHLQWLLSSLGDFLCNHVSYLCVALLAAPLVLRGAAGRTALVFLASGLVLWLLFVPYFEPPRYYLGLAAIAQAAAAATAYRLWETLRQRAAILDLAISLYLCLRSIPVLIVGLHLLTDPGLLQAAQGGISRAAWLGEHVRPYRAEQWASSHAAPGARVVLVNVLPGYYMDRPYQGDRRAEFALWCRQGVRYAVFDRGDGSPDAHIGAVIRPLIAFAWARAPGLAPRVLYSANSVDALAVDPCAAAR